MGKIYKIKPEIKEFILKQARSHPELGCRKLCLLVKEQFQVSISKSSVNTILKSGGISSPIGRRLIHQRRRPKLTSGITETSTAAAQVPFQAQQSPAATTAAQTPPGEIIDKAQQPLPKSQSPEPPLLPTLEAIDKAKAMPIFSPPECQYPGQALPSVSSQIIAPVSQPEAVNQGLGYWFLKAAELSLGGIQEISKALSLTVKDKDIAEFIAKNETLLYLPLFGIEDPKMLDNLPSGTGLSALVGKTYSAAEISAYSDYLRPLGSLNLLLLTQISSCLSSVRCLRFVLNDKICFFTDGKGHSVWSTSNVPQFFSWPFPRVRECLTNSILTGRQPFILQAPPGFEEPAGVFFNFIQGLETRSEDRRIKQIDFLGQQNELLESVNLEIKDRRLFIIGLWPWQYQKVISVENVGDFDLFNFDLSSEDFSVAESRIGLKSKALAEPLGLRGVILKRGQDKLLTMLTNIENTVMNTEQLACLYLECWPNLELGYQDFLGKIARASYSKWEPAVSQVNMSALAETTDLDLNRILGFWRIKLSEFCQNYFFPLNCQKLDFFTLKERFYDLGGQIESKIGHFKIKFNVQSGYQYLDDLIYSCQRVNESNIILPVGMRLVFEINNR